MATKNREGIRQRGNSWLVDLTINGKRRTKTCSSYEEAKVARLQMEAEARGKALGMGQPAESESWSLQKAYMVTLETRWQHGRNEGKCKAAAKEAMDHFGAETKLDAITTTDVDRYIKKLRSNGNASATVNRKLAALSAMFTDAIHRDGCTRKPRIIRQPEPRHRIRYLSKDEEVTLVGLMTQWGQQGVAETIMVLIDTGMRVGELLAMAPRDIDQAQGIISIWKNKADLPRSIPMTDRVRRIITRRLEGKPTTLFHDVHREVLRYYWDRARSAMDLDNDTQFVPHALRHTCASRLVQAGVSLYVVQKLLGHSTIAVTEKYAHLNQDALRGAIDVLQGSSRPHPQHVADPRNIVADGERSKLRASA